MVEIINRKQTTLQTIESAFAIQHHRPYLGMSSLGHSCNRYLWYTFRWCYEPEKITARKLRLFSRGHKEESSVISMLTSVGIEVYDEQLEAIAGYGHIKGHIDGKAIGVIEAPKTVHLLEIKTANDASHKKLCKNGIKNSNTVYFVQMQLYMHYFKLTRALFVSVNKNNDSLYIERVEFESTVSKEYIEKGEGILLSELPPDKQFAPTWYECKWCAAMAICHEGKSVEKNCRTCKQCDMLNGGIWECSINNKQLTVAEQRGYCDKYESFI